MLIGIRAGACLVAGAGAPALAARPSSVIHIYVSQNDTNLYPQNALPVQ